MRRAILLGLGFEETLRPRVSCLYITSNDEDDYVDESKKKEVVKENAIAGEKKVEHLSSLDKGENTCIDGQVEDVSDATNDAVDDAEEECVGDENEDHTPAHHRVVVYDELFVASQLQLPLDDDDFLNFSAFSVDDAVSKPPKEDVERHKLWGPARDSHVIKTWS
ncbi:hypothetical protein L484_003788 [Morus notabilis]|uniref:Uncharacterized protein n=1 Tax=Morus notabilis TaxID=981085 RepID=W9QKB7_9ROSA|nr:hypothetical protein L484_003788 [Morus notabilis]